MKLKRPLLISKGSLDRILQAAQQAWHQKDFQQNIELLERASRLAPSNVGIHLQLGRIHGLRYDYAAAERCSQKMLVGGAVEGALGIHSFVNVIETPRIGRSRAS